jgi:hypothetical protein
MKKKGQGNTNEFYPKVWDPVEGKVKEANILDSHIMIATDLKVDKGMFGYYVVVAKKKELAHKELSQEEIRKTEEIFELLSEDYEAEVDSAEFYRPYILLKIILAPFVAPLDFLTEIKEEFEESNLPFYYGFLVTLKKPKPSEIRKYIKNLWSRNLN